MPRQKAATSPSSKARPTGASAWARVRRRRRRPASGLAGRAPLDGEGEQAVHVLAELAGGARLAGCLDPLDELNQLQAGDGGEIAAGAERSP